MLESVQGTLGSPVFGTYRVRASEVARHRALSCIRVQVVFLDESTQVYELEKRSKGQVLLDLVFKQIDLLEREYFGLQFVDALGGPDVPMRWLDPLKSVKKQLRLSNKSIGNMAAPLLYFRVKFWVSDPGKLTDEFTRYQLVYQIKMDIASGRMIVPPSSASLLASYALQAEVGDYNQADHGSHYLDNYQLVPHQTQEVVQKIIELHKLHKGQSPADAEFNFLDQAKRLELYGIDLHRAKDSIDRDINIGVTSTGLVILHNGLKMNSFSWLKITKVSFKRKHFYVQLRRDMTENYENVLVFNLSSYRACKALWKSCVEHHTFFRLHAPYDPSKKRNAALTLGSKFRYSGRTEYQTLEEGKRRSMGERKFTRSPSRLLATRSVPSLSESSFSVHRPSITTSGSTLRPRSDANYRVISLTGPKVPKLAWIDMDVSMNGDSSGDLTTKDLVIPSSFPEPSPRSLKVEPADSATAPETSLPSSPSPSNGSLSVEELQQGLVVIRMRADSGGKYGFNVKGGADQNQPVLVSKVTPSSPADTCYPRLNEGDQVMFINGLDVSRMSHVEVVKTIRNCSERSGLILKVKQNVYEAEGIDEPSFQYVPETVPEHASSRRGSGDTRAGGALEESMLLLAEALESGALVAQFEQLYRRKPGLAALEARKPENEKKNRYRDISPYDATRVILESAASGDYINASHVVMRVPKSGLTNRYIACQGPLSGTCADFWSMVWDQKSTLVVMLTTVVEQGRVKCHRYWPKLNDSVEYGRWRVRCDAEHETPGFAFRELALTNTESDEERAVSHMQYLAWPDHGVPDDSVDFLKFVTRVRETRTDMSEPTIVHCSAGIGRTGVLILMETAQCLIEANEPVYPLDVVREMRNQRAMMIQTASQYRFVCEAIQRVYAEGQVEPLPRFVHR